MRWNGKKIDMVHGSTINCLSEKRGSFLLKINENNEKDA